MHSVSHLLNDWGLEFKHKGGKFVFQENIHVLMLTVFDAKMLTGGSQEKKEPERGMQDGGGGSGLDPLFPHKIGCNFKNKQQIRVLGNTSNVNIMFDGVNAGRRGYSR